MRTVVILAASTILIGGSCKEEIEKAYTAPHSKKIEYADKVVVKKKDRKMYLYKKNKILNTFKISLGFTPIGHKKKEGDGKTPEGDYTLDWRNAKSICYKSIHISYPNKKDKAQARKKGVSPGGAIMIHGLMNGYGWMGKSHLASDWTNGCVAVTNKEMDIIWKKVKNGTPIRIDP